MSSEMTVYGRNINLLRCAREWSLQELAQPAHTTPVTIWRIENGANASIPMLHRIAKALDVEVEELFKDPNARPKALIHKIPILSRIRAGEAFEYTNGDYPPKFAEDYVYCSESLPDSAAFALRVEGNSMEPTYRDGDLLLVCPNLEAQSGNVVIYRLQTGECAVKRMRTSESGEIILTSDNLKYGAPQVFRGPDFAFIYPVYMALKGEY